MSRAYFTEEHDQLREQVRRFVREEVLPIGDLAERQGFTPRALIRKAGDLGFLGLRYPTRFGGSEMDLFGEIVLAEELARSTYGGVTDTLLVHTSMAAPHLFNAGNEAQLEKYAPGVISGELLTAIAVTEADAGSDVGGLRTKARRDGDRWILNGTKMYTSSGCNADLYFVAARTDPDAKGSRGLSMFILEPDTPGFKVGRKLEKMGIVGNDTAELVFEDVELPAENLLGEEGTGFYAAMKNFQNERLILCAWSMSEAMTALKMTIEYAKVRKTFGVPLIERQIIRQRLAMLHAKVEAGRQLIYHTAKLEQQGKKPIMQVAMLKAYCGELVNETLYACQQFHGGFGYLRESAIERMVRDVRLHAIGGGATEIMLEEIVKRWDSVPEFN